MAASVLETLSKITAAKVLCLGDLMLDRYIYGQASRLSPEAPVPIVAVRRKALMPGGLGNVVMNLHSLGSRPLAVGLVGRDHWAPVLSDLLSAATGKRPPLLIEEPGRPTTVKTRVIAGIQQIVRFDEESLSPLPEETVQRYREAIEKLLPLCGAVAASDYGKGALSPPLLSWLMAKCDSLALPVVVDPKGGDYGRYRGAALVTPNRQELALAVGQDLSALADEKAMTQAGRRLMEAQGLKNLLITRSEDGMTLLTSDGATTHFPARAREVFDVSGAGDTVVAAMAAALAAGQGLPAGAELATLAAAVVVGKVGTATATPAEIKESLRSR
jgi:D-beta-D-heptose 7-phosphate kinase/D-beta-D-heptose 1-phosphate adenosyltransferase